VRHHLGPIAISSANKAKEAMAQTLARWRGLATAGKVLGVLDISAS